MNKLLLSVLLIASASILITSQAAFAGCPEGECGCEGEECNGEGGFDNPKPKFTSPNGKVMIDPVTNFGVTGTDFTLHWRDTVTITRDTSMDCSDGAGGFVPPTSVFLNAGPFSDRFDNEGNGEEEGGLFNFVIPTATALEQGQTISKQMFPTGNPDEVGTTIGPLFPSHGNGPISFDITCPPSSTNTNIDSFFDIFIDPSGLVLDACTGEGIADVEVELSVNRFGLGFESGIQEFFDDPQDGGIISPNDGGVQFTFNDGSYGWDVAPFGYSWLVTIVDVPFPYQQPGPGTASQGPFVISSQEDAVTDADFYLQPIGQSCLVGGEMLPIDATSLVVAGIQTSAMWILPIAFAGAGFAAFKLRKYWN